MSQMFEQLHFYLLKFIFNLHTVTFTLCAQFKRFWQILITFRSLINPKFLLPLLSWSTARRISTPGSHRSLHPFASSRMACKWNSRVCGIWGLASFTGILPLELTPVLKSIQLIPAWSWRGPCSAEGPTVFIPPPERGCLGIFGDGKHSPIGLVKISAFISLGKGLRVGLLGHTTSAHLTTWGNTKLFPKLRCCCTT